jgi:hypothetical protein
MVPKFLEGFSTRMFFADERFCSRNRSTCFFSWPDPLPGMISSSGAFFAMASSNFCCSAFSISEPLL